MSELDWNGLIAKDCRLSSGSITRMAEAVTRQVDESVQEVSGAINYLNMMSMKGETEIIVIMLISTSE